MDNIEAIKEMLAQSKWNHYASQVTEAVYQDLFKKVGGFRSADQGIDRGIYIKPEILEDEMYFLQYKYGKVIFSHESSPYIPRYYR
jgi:hypothetical protein